MKKRVTLDMLCESIHVATIAGMRAARISSKIKAAKPIHDPAPSPSEYAGGAHPGEYRYSIDREVGR